MTSHPTRSIHRVWWALLIAVLPMLACGVPYVVAPFAESESTAPRMVCPTVTPLPTIVRERTVVSYRSAEEPTPTIVVERIPTRPYEREYGAPFTPTPYAEPVSSVSFGVIVTISEDLDALIESGGAPITIDHQLVTLLPVRLTIRSSREWTWNPVWHLVLTEYQVGDTVTRGEWFLRPEDNTETISTDRFDMQIPSGQTSWTVWYRIPGTHPNAQPRAVDLRLRWMYADDRANPPPLVSVRWIDRPIAANPYCPNPVGAWYGASFEPSPRAIAMPSDVSTMRQRVVSAAMSQLRRPYCFGAKGWNPCPRQCFGSGSQRVCYPGCGSYPCFDCSGLTFYAWQSAGVVLPHGSQNQAVTGIRRASWRDAEPGDLIFFWDSPRSRRAITHVGIHLGDINNDGRPDMIHAGWYTTSVELVLDWPRSPLFERFAWIMSPIP